MASVQVPWYVELQIFDKKLFRCWLFWKSLIISTNFQLNVGFCLLKAPSKIFFIGRVFPFSQWTFWGHYLDQKEPNNRIIKNAFAQKYSRLITCQRFGDFFFFGLVWQYSTNQNQYNKGRFKVTAGYLLAAVI